LSVTIGADQQVPSQIDQIEEKEAVQSAILMRQVAKLVANYKLWIP